MRRVSIVERREMIAFDLGNGQGTNVLLITVVKLTLRLEQPNKRDFRIMG
jgi:hypothetical protein